MKIGIIGAGAWGSALAVAAGQGGNKIVLWSYDGISQFNAPTTQNMHDLTDCDLWMIATPSEFFADTIAKAHEFYKGQPIVICTKGLGQGGKLLSEILIEIIPECTDIGVLSGPGFAAEVAAGAPTGTTIAGNAKIIELALSVFPEFYKDATDDIIGAQICGAGKNAVAVIMGYVATRSENEKALTLTRAWDEVVRIGIASGAKIETFLMLCGIGDLFLTATSKTSRNFTAGTYIASGRTPQGTVEGISALHELITMANKLEIDTPILKSIKI